MAGTDGRKMSKSYGNYPDPKETILKYGADALRLYFMGSSLMLAEDVAINEDSIMEQIKTIILPLWNSFSFLVTYSQLKGYEPSPDLVQKRTDDENWAQIPIKPKDQLNVWILAKLQQTIRKVRAGFEEYNMPKVVREYPEFIADLSRWYIRRSRNKFAENDAEFFDTLYYVLVEFAKLLAPVAPYISEEIYQSLVKEPLENQFESIHLADFPDDDRAFLDHSGQILEQMEIVREIVKLGQALRVENSLKVRQPLAELEVNFDTDPAREYELEDWMKKLIAQELNVKQIQEDAKVNDYAGWVKTKSDKYNLEIGLNTNISTELKREGILRELQRGIQAQRKREKLDVEDQVEVEIISDFAEISEVIKIYKQELEQSVKAKSVTFVQKTTENKVINVDGHSVDIRVTK
jgi:isoleucyl-tRNA synthetase